MKFKHLILAAFAAFATVAACQKPAEDLGEPNIDLSETSLAFEQGGSQKTITLKSTRDWKASDIADWIVVDPESGKASADNQTVTITVAENTGANRDCTIKFSCGLDKEYLTVSQSGPQGGPVAGDGSKENPYLASQANELASALASGEEDGPYYIKGYVKKFASKHEDGIKNFGNALFYITDEKDAPADALDFYCYQVYYLGNTKFTSLDQIAVGDEVIVYGNITNYNGTPETVGKGAAFIYSLNGKTEGGDNPGPGPGPDPDIIDGTNLLDNGGFEDWTGDKPAGWDFTNGNAALTKSSDAKSGSNACEIGGDAENNKRLMSKSYDLLPGTYQIQAYVKGEGKYRVGYAKLTDGVVKDTKNDYIYIDNDAVPAGADWELHMVQFTLAEETEISVNFMNNRKGEGKSILVDDVKLVTNDGGLGEGGDTPPTPPGPDFNTSLENPASASEALAYAQTLDADTQVEAYVKGIISEIKEVDETGQFGNATYFISDDGKTAGQFEIFRGYYLGGEKFTSADQIKVGDEVIVFGKIVNYKGETPEMTSGSKIMSLNGKTADEGGADEGGDTDGISWTIDNNAKSYEAEVTANGTKYKGFKLGTGSAVGTATLNIPAGTKKISFCCVGWKAKPSEVEFVDASGVVKTIQPASNDGATGNPPFTMTVADSDYYDLTLDGQTSLTVRSTDNGFRVVLFDFVAE